MADNSPFPSYPDPFAVRPEPPATPPRPAQPLQPQMPQVPLARPQAQPPQMPRVPFSQKSEAAPLPLPSAPRAQAAPFASAIEPAELPPPPGPSYSEDIYSELDDEEAAKRTVVGVVVGVLVLLVLGGVGVWYYLSRDSMPPVPPPAEDPNFIKADKGGRIVTADGVEIVIPANALAADTRIWVERVETGRVTDLFHLLPDGLKFLKPVTVAVPYKESGLQSGETAYDIELSYWLALGGQPKFLDYTIEEETKKLRTWVNEF